MKSADDIPTIRRRTLAMLNGTQNAMGEADCLIELQLLEEEKSRMQATDRKKRPVATGVLDYFPDAIMEIALVSHTATQQHHPDGRMHWDKSKSTDEADALMRHLLERGKRDTDGMRHTAKVAWRALALLQREIYAEQESQPANVDLPSLKKGDAFKCSDCSSIQVFRASHAEFIFGKDMIVDTGGTAHQLSSCRPYPGCVQK